MWSHRGRPLSGTELEKLTGLAFADQGPLQQALTHPSYLNEHPELQQGSNQRLEFLGDAVLALVVAHELFERFPHLPEGELTKLRSHLVNGKNLAKVARELGVGEHLILGHGEKDSGGMNRDSNLAAALEAIVGAVFVKRGYRAASKLSLVLLRGELEEILAQEAPEDPKSRLQELLQSMGEAPPQYHVTGMEGPDHNPSFTVDVITASGVLSTGRGKRKNDAEKEAAKEAYKRLT